MKRIFIITLAIGTALAVGYGFVWAQHGYGGHGMGHGGGQGMMHGGGQGMMRGGQGGWTCPWMSGNPAPGGWYCPWMSGQGSGMQNTPPASTGIRPGQALNQEQAKTLLERYAIRGNPNLKVGQIVDKGDYHEAEILNQAGQVVQRIQVNKQTGWFRMAQ